MSNEIHVAHLTKSFGNVRAINDVDLDIPAGQIVGLMGENGSGKTTLLKILSGVMLDYEGEVALNGQRPGLPTKAHTSFLPDASASPARLNGRQVAQMYADFFADFNIDRAVEKLHYFQVPLDRPAARLSKGQREKLQIAMAIAREADFYFFDEPLSGVDPAARDQILHGILADLPEHSTMLISTHLIQDIEAIVSHAVFMHAGTVRLAGDADELRSEYGVSLDGLFRQMYRWEGK
ncbi:MAG: ABC transporter ATP-binding protein [Actinomycetaceae bacterium]|nr:ABC transporter ATP-binding protein [Actinomycetaceae bacterium]MDY5854705.1 ABC transporter ATP-binding protein [Arcanobacterium sp.]